MGAPGFDDDVPNSGLVTSFWIDDDEDPRAHGTLMMGLGEPVSDMPVEGAALGSSLSVAGGLVAMGAPGMVYHEIRDGMVLVDLDQVDIDPDRPLGILSQATRGVPGKPEANDRFGAAVHLVASPHGGATTLLIGAPGEDLGRIRDAGTVTVARISPTTLELSGTVRVVDQDSPGMAGTAEPGDAFGSSVSSMRNGSAINYLVGVPGEDVGRVRDAGMVQTIGTGKGWTQRSKGVPGIAEAGDRMGASLAGGAAAGARRPLIGIPGEDASAGAVDVGLPIGGVSVGYLKGSRAGDRYGFSVGP